MPGPTAAATETNKTVTETNKKFLDENQYTKNGILRYEFIFGKGFISTGGRESTEKITECLKLKENDSCLDVGCGIGGGAEFLSTKFKVNVLGVDLAENCVGIAKERYAGNKNLRFEFADIMSTTLVQPNSLDLVYSRDAILHIADKATLFKRFAEWLKPGGQVFISDYCAAPPAKQSVDFKQYLVQRNYSLTTVDDYAATLKGAGLEIVKAEDSSSMFTDILKVELERLEKGRESFLKNFTTNDLDELSQGWKRKIEWVKEGQQTWGVFLAKKP
eukprot:Selendium_serpulae@DN874_c0_g1_i1.p1